MDQNGFNSFNNFDGPVFVEGDVDINGNLDVTGTINGGGGGGGSVNNPMTEDLNAGNYLIYDVSEISGFEGVLKTSLIDVQDNDIINVNEIKGNSGANVLYISANVEMLENLNMTNKNIGHVNEISGQGGVLKTSILDLQNNNIQEVNTIYTTGITSSTGATAFTSILNMFNDINMDNNDIFNVERITTSHAGVSINLDLVPATEGKAGQVLARDPAFVPGNFATHKLVWQTPSGGGGITNPLTANLQAAQYNILDAQTIESKYINIIATGNGLACANGSFAVPITWGLAQKLSLAPFYQTFNTDYITPATNLGLVIDSKAPDGITDSKITLSAPNIIFNNSTNLSPSLVTITGNLQITNSSGYIHGNNLIVRGRNSSAVPTPLTIEGTTTSINSSTLNITSSIANNITGTTFLDGILSFIGANQINHVNALTGYSPSYVNLYLDIIPSTEGTAGQVLTRDPAFTVGNPATYKLVWTTPATGNVTNPMTAVLDGANYDIENIRKITLQEIDSPDPNILVFKRLACYDGINVDSKSIFNLGSIVNAIPASTLTVTSPNISLEGKVTTTTNLNVLTARSSTIGVRTTLFKTFGAMPNINLNTLTPVKINTTIANQRGTNLIPANGFVNGDKFIIIMYGSLTTIGSGSLNISLNVGATTALNFIVINVASASQPCKITIEIDCTVSGNNVGLENGTALLSMERTNTSIRFATANSSNLFSNLLANNTFDIYMYQSATQTSNFTPLSYTIEQM